MGTSIISDGSLAALGISIPGFARDRTARICEKADTRTQFDYYKCCGCDRLYHDLGSLVVQCHEHVRLGIQNTNPLELVDINNPQTLAECSSSVKVRETRKRTSVTESAKQTFECKECSTWYTERYKYNDHIVCHKNPMLKRCEICKTQFQSGIRARRHIAQFHPELLQQREEEYKQTKGDNERKRTKKKKEVSQVANKSVDVTHLEPEQDTVAVVPENDTDNSMDVFTEPFPSNPVEKPNKVNPDRDNYRTQCPICLAPCLSYNMKAHIIKHNLYSSSTVCLICSRDVKSNIKLKRHMKYNHKTNWYDFIREQTKAQIDKGQAEGLIYCKVCFLPFENAEEKDVHLLIAHPSKKCKSNLECRVCKKQYNSPVNRRIHELRFHSNDPLLVNTTDYVCDLCGASYKFKGHLKQHMKKHTGPAKFYSEATQKRYGLIKKTVPKGNRRNKHRYEMQFIKQDDDKVVMRFVCLECDVQFLNHEAVKTHLRENHPRKPRNYICEHCGVAFAEKHNLSSHLATVHGDKAISDNTNTQVEPNAIYECKYCEQQFTSQIKCRFHEMYHTRIQENLCCEICGAKVRTKEYLRDHMKRHQEKNLLCHYPGCDQRFTVTQNLKMHIKRYHLQAEVFKCRYCPNTYKSWNGRCYHEFKYHDGKKWRGQHKAVALNTQEELVE